MRISENRPIAWIVLGVCVIGSIVGMGGSAMVRERKKVVDVFYNGTITDSQYRESMDEYLDRARDYAGVMAHCAIGELGDDCVPAQEMLSLMDDLESTDLDVRFTAYEKAKLLSDDLYDKMDSGAATGNNWKDFKGAYDNFWEKDKQIRFSDYHQLATGYNAGRDGVLAKTVTGIVGAGDLNTFGS